MTHPFLALSCLLVVLPCQGCSVYLAASQPDEVDIAALEQGGMPRDAVISKIGGPISSTKNANGTRTDVYEFYEGSATGWKVGRATFHLIADIFTAALWEIIATPTELAIRGSKITARADYDQRDIMTVFKILGREKPIGAETSEKPKTLP